MSPSTQVGRSWDWLTRILRRAPRTWVSGGVLVLYCSVLALAPGYAAPPSLLEQAQQRTDEAYRLSQAGRYQDAIPLAEDALRWREMALGSMHPDVAHSLQDPATLYYRQCRYTEAEPLLQRAIAIREQALGPTDPEVAQSLNHLAIGQDVIHAKAMFGAEEGKPLAQPGATSRV